MTDFGASFGAGHRRDAGDPILEFIRAMQDAWGSAFAAMRSQAGQASPSPTPPGAGWLRGDPAGSTAVLSQAMGQACLIAAGSTLAYWRGLAEVYARHQASLMRVASSGVLEPATGAPSETWLLADELRAFFREVGEVALAEARRLQAELERVGEEVANALAEPQDRSAPYWRRWKVKA